MTPTKESLELSSSSAEPEISQGKGRNRPESPHLRADAVSLEIPVNAHGSLVPDFGAGGTPQAQPFEEQTTTMIVFPQGGVLKMSTAVSAGQAMVITNLRSRQDAICRVVKVRAYGKTQSYVEVEFTSAQPGYWGVYFPSDGPEVARMAVAEKPADSATPADSPANPVQSAPRAEPAVPAVNPAPAPVECSSVAKPSDSIPQPDSTKRIDAQISIPPKIPAQPQLPHSAFISIGAREEVQPSAASTQAARAKPSADRSAERAADTDDISDAIDALAAPSAPGVSQVRPAASAAAAKPAQSNPTEMFGFRLNSAAHSAATESQPQKSKLLIPVAIAAIVVIAGAAYYAYSRFGVSRAVVPAHSAGTLAAAAQPTIQSSATPPATPAPSENTQAPTSQSGDQSQSPQPAASARELPSRAETSPRPSRASATLPERRAALSADESAPARPVRSTAVLHEESAVAIPSTFGALTTRPVINRQSAGSPGAAPALEPGGSPAPATSALSEIAAPVPSLPAPPKPVSAAPIRVGGKILPPKILSSVLPEYPLLAQQAGVTGTVVIDTTIGKDGRVAKMKVISGPELLRDAALKALRQWKYAPSKLNGEPISVEMIVSIRFNR